MNQDVMKAARFSVEQLGGRLHAIEMANSDSWPVPHAKMLILAGIEAATQPAEAAPSDAAIEAWRGNLRHAWDDECGCEDEGVFELSQDQVDEAVALMRRNRQQADRAVEALRGLVEAVDKLRASENTERRKGYARAFADDVLLGELFDVASAAKEVLRG